MPRLQGKRDNTLPNLLVALLVLLLVLAIIYFAYLKPNDILNLGF